MAVRTKHTYNKYQHIINPNNYPLGKCGMAGAYQIDHIISVKAGFVNGLDIDFLSAKENLQVITWEDNNKKMWEDRNYKI